MAERSRTEKGHSIEITDTDLGLELVGYRSETDVFTNRPVDQQRGVFVGSTLYDLGKDINIESIKAAATGVVAFLLEVGIGGKVAWDLSQGRLSKKRFLAYGAVFGLTELVRRRSFKFANSCDEWFMDLVNKYPYATVPMSSSKLNSKAICPPVRTSDSMGVSLMKDSKHP